MLYLKGFITRLIMGLVFIASLQVSTNDPAEALKEENPILQPNSLHYNNSIQKDLLLLSSGQFNENRKSCSTADSNCSAQKKE